MEKLTGYTRWFRLSYTFEIVTSAEPGERRVLTKPPVKAPAPSKRQKERQLSALVASIQANVALSDEQKRQMLAAVGGFLDVEDFDAVPSDARRAGKDADSQG